MGSILVTEESGTLRLAWDNRVVLKERFAFWFLIVFWIIWAPVTLFATISIFVVPDAAVFLICWNVFGWLGTFGIPYTLLSRRWREWIEVSAAVVTVGAAGLLAPRPRTHPIENVREMVLNWYHDGYEHVSMAYLQIVLKQAPWYRRKVMIGYWLNRDLKREVFETIRAFVEARQIPLKMTTCGDVPAIAAKSDASND